MTDFPLSEDARRAQSSPTPDAHGQASLLLVESLLHVLISRSLLTATDAVQVVEVATEVGQEMADAASDNQASTQSSMTLLETIGASLRTDVRRGPTSLG